MDDGPTIESLARAVRGLTIAVVFLAVLLLTQFAMYAYSYFRYMTFSRAAASSTSAGHPGGPARSREVPAEADPFDRLTPEERVKRSSAILLTKHVQDGGRLKAIVAEIVKKAPGASLAYRVGDEIPSLSHYDADVTRYGDGEVVFFTDSQSGFQESMTYRGGRIQALGDMPLETLREMAAGKSSSAPKSPASQPPPVRTAMALAGMEPRDSIDLERSTNGEGVTRVFSISRRAAEKIPVWLPEKGEPPLPMSRAIRLATAAAQAESPKRDAFLARAIRLQLVSCDCGESERDRWYYVVDCVPSLDDGLAMKSSVPVVVLMDGSVVTGQITPS